ncbi:hypothetical protein ACH5Y9_14305 [Methylomonas sp. BW4-1]|uniref:hypothetical protein n=1 Tax=Methylomonas sp. BW4-1 TaxID=3376685 RepID=UPI0040420CB0
MNIKTGTLGKIESGDETGAFIKIIDDSQNTGGFIIVTSSSPELKNGFDNWVKDKNTLDQYFQESGWVITWF